MKVTSLYPATWFLRLWVIIFFQCYYATLEVNYLR